jgi:hypothetical protein
MEQCPTIFVNCFYVASKFRTKPVDCPLLGSGKRVRFRRRKIIHRCIEGIIEGIGVSGHICFFEKG